MSPTFYLTRAADGSVELRQTRYRERYEAGRPHPWDVCAVAGSKNQMRQMTMSILNPIDWTTIPEDE